MMTPPPNTWTLLVYKIPLHQLPYAQNRGELRRSGVTKPHLQFRFPRRVYREARSQQLQPLPQGSDSGMGAHLGETVVSEAEVICNVEQKGVVDGGTISHPKHDIAGESIAISLSPD